MNYINKVYTEHLGNNEEIMQSEKVYCLQCKQIMLVSELVEIQEDMKWLFEQTHYCPNCQVADCMIGDKSGIEFSKKNLHKIGKDLIQFINNFYI